MLKRHKGTTNRVKNQRKTQKKRPIFFDETLFSFFIEFRSSLLSLGIADASIALLSLNRSLLH